MHIGAATRLCNTSGNWNKANLTNCSSCGHTFLKHMMNQVPNITFLYMTVLATLHAYNYT